MSMALDPVHVTLSHWPQQPVSHFRLTFIRSCFFSAYSTLCCNAMYSSRFSTLHCLQHHCYATKLYDCFLLGRLMSVYTCTSVSLPCLLIKTKRQGRSLNIPRILITFTLAQIGKSTCRKLSAYKVAEHAMPRKHRRSCTGYFVLISIKSVMSE